MTNPISMLRALALCAGMVSCAIPATAQAAPALPLGHAGRWIIDARGRVVILHGTNLVYKGAPYHPAAGGFGEDDAAFLHSIGFNTVRVGVIWKAIEPQPGVYDDAYLQWIEQTVTTLAKHGIVSLLDSHQDMYNEEFEGEGFPDWSVQDDGLESTHEGFPNNYFVDVALWRAFEHFWANSPGPDGVGLQDHYAAAWARIAQRFAGNPHVVGYELMNEPFPGGEWTTCSNPEGCPVFDEKLSAFYRKVDGAIRSVDPRMLVWYEPNVSFNFGVKTHVKSLGPLSGFSFHDYCLANEAEGCPTHETTINNAEQYVAVSGDALLMDEWGATNSVSDLETMVSLADQHMVPWTEWEYCGCNELGTPRHDPQGLIYDESKPPKGENVVSGKLDALVEPYPEVISGTPRSWSFDRKSATFGFQYRTQAADGTRAFRSGSLTQIATPKVSYPSGYAVQASGGKVVSNADAQLLKIASCPGAGEVAVTVAPGIAPSQGC